MADERYQGDDKRRDDSLRERFRDSVVGLEKKYTHKLIAFFIVTVLSQGGWVYTSTVLNNERIAVIQRKVDILEAEQKAALQLNIKLAEAKVVLDQLTATVSKLETMMGDMARENHRDRMRRGLADER